MSDDLHNLMKHLPPEDSTRLLEVTSALSHAAAALGIGAVDARTLQKVESIRLAVLAGRDFRVEEGLAELRALPEIAERVAAHSATAAARAALDAKAASITDRAERMTWARGLGGHAGAKQGAPSEPLDRETAINIASGLKGAAKAAFARRHGLM